MGVLSRGMQRETAHTCETLGLSSFLAGAIISPSANYEMAVSAVVMRLG